MQCGWRLGALSTELLGCVRPKMSQDSSSKWHGTKPIVYRKRSWLNENLPQYIVGRDERGAGRREKLNLPPCNCGS